MSYDGRFALEDFVRGFLTSRGAEVESVGAALEVLLPKQLAETIGVPEYCELDLRADATGEFSVHYGRPLLEKMTAAAAGDIPFTALRVAFPYVKSQGFDNLIQEQFRFLNAVGRVENSAQTQTDYLLLSCRYMLQSDEQKEELVTLGFNLETGAPADEVVDRLSTVEKQVDPSLGAVTIDAATATRIAEWAERRMPAVMEPRIAAFRESMNRRYRRDVAHLEEYYAGVKEEMQAALRRPGLGEETIRDREAKIAMLGDELAGKKADLYKKYGIKADMRLCAAMLVRSPAVKVFFQAAVGKAKKQLALIYNPIVKAFDPLLCCSCGQGTYPVAFDRNLQPRCPKCFQG
jgi:hypothetical protein